MKVIKRPAPPIAFVPVVIEITLETEKEQTDWFRLTSNNLCIPGFLRTSGRISAEDEQRLTLFMSKLCHPKEENA